MSCCDSWTNNAPTAGKIEKVQPTVCLLGTAGTLGSKLVTTNLIPVYFKYIVWGVSTPAHMANTNGDAKFEELRNRTNSEYARLHSAPVRNVNLVAAIAAVSVRASVNLSFD